MNTVIYIDVARNKKRLIRILLCTAVILLACFVLSLILDAVFPELNMHMDFSKAIASFFVFYDWDEHLYCNVWNLIAFILPFIFTYVLMVEFACAIVEEEEFETLSYMRCLGIERETILFSKLIIRIVWALAFCAILFLENLVFFLIINEKKMIWLTGAYSLKLFMLGLFHLCVAMFVAACSIRERSCTIVCVIIMLFEFVTARLHSYIRLLADSLFVSGKKYNEIEWIYGVSARLDSLKVLCPIKLCYPGQSVTLAYGICVAAIGIVLFAAGYSIYTRDKVVFRNQ